MWKAIWAFILFILIFGGVAGAGPVDPDALVRRGMARGGFAAAPAAPSAPRVATTRALEDIAKPLDAVAISLDIAQARYAVAAPSAPAAPNIHPARGGQPATPAKLLNGVN